MAKCAFILFCLIPFFTSAQRVVVKGYAQDISGSLLPLAHITLIPDSLTTTSDTEGQFLIKTTPGRKTFIISYTGYRTLRKELDINTDTTVQFTLEIKVDELQEVVVTSQKYSQQDLFESTRTGTTTLTQDDITGIPVLGGEADIIKTLQLLPGTLRGVEGSSDVFVRGGAADQNLVLLDDAPIYNSSHLFGFLSVFNPDAIDKVDAVNGGFPSEYGGRLSSILDVKTTSDIMNQTRVSGDIGIIASRLYLEKPVVKDKASFWIAGRRTYIDQVAKAAGEDLPYFFYDLNAKLNLRPTLRDKIELSFYGGDDVLDWFRDRNNDGDGLTSRFESGNNSQTLQWTHSLKNGWTWKLSGLRSAYRYKITYGWDENQLLALSDIEDIGSRIQFSKDSVGKTGSIKTGIDWTQHTVSPNVINTDGFFEQIFESAEAPGRRAQEFAYYGQYEFSLLEPLRINAGLRTSVAVVEGKTYINPEPRLSLRYSIDKNNSAKLSYSRMVQYMHRVSSSAISTPTDIWYPVTATIRPQTSDQISAAWQRYFTTNNLFLSVEGYYKKMDHLIGYEEGTNLFFNTDFESQLIQGSGRAYGIEFLLRKQTGKLTGWISYTLSWSQRRFDAINDGNWFNARYDRRHNGAIVMQYSLHKRWAVSIVAEYISGARFTPVTGQYAVVSPTLTGVNLIPLYAPVNSVKLADTHRVDLGVKFKSKQGKKFQWQWFAGVYNVYNRANPIGINIEQDESDGSLRYEQPGLFGLLPFISYGFKF